MALPRKSMWTKLSKSQDTPGASSPKSDYALPDSSSVEPVDAGAAPQKIKAMVMNRTVWVMVIVAVVFLGLGLAASKFVISPSQAAAETDPPESGPITVPVEMKKITNDILARGDVKYDDAVEVTLGPIETGGGNPIVTGAVPKVGDELKAGTVALEVVGRPVIVLPGDLPVYRTLRSGSSGPDVAQLRDALNSLGYSVGEGDQYDANLAAGVSRLFAQAGYAAPQVEEAVQTALTSAQENVQTAQQAVEEAQVSLNSAGAGPNESTRIQLDNAVNQAKRQLDDAQNCVNSKASDCPSVPDAQDAVTLAEAQRSEGLAPESTSAQQSALSIAQQNLRNAQETLSTAQADALTPFPASEVIYLPSLPRRVDTISVDRGSAVPSTPFMTVSGANLQIECNLSQADADLLKPGDVGTIDVGGTTVNVTLKELEKSNQKTTTADETSKEGTTSSQIVAIMVPDKLTDDQREQLAGSNVKVTIPVSATDGEVLSVPVAALTAGAGGETRVEVLREDAKEPELVVVETGLSANGYVEIVKTEGTLEPGDLVMVGQ